MPDSYVVIVEIPGGSRNKYEYDHESGAIFLDRRLFTATRYPTDYGFFPETLAEDGDPLDALVLVSDPTFPGCHIRVRPIGVFWMEDEKGPDAKVVTVPVSDPVSGRITSIEDLEAVRVVDAALGRARRAAGRLRRRGQITSARRA